MGAENNNPDDMMFDLWDDYPHVTERYSDVDITRSLVRIKKDEGLAKKVSELAENLGGKKLPVRVALIKEFYKEYLNDKLAEPDPAGAKIDLSTLVYAAAIEDIVFFGYAGLLAEADQVYQRQERRLNWALIGKILGPLVNRLKWNSDVKKAKERDDYEMHTHVMYFKAEAQKRIQQGKEVGEEIKNVANGMANTLKSSQNGATQAPDETYQTPPEEENSPGFIKDPDVPDFLPREFYLDDDQPPAET